MLNGDLDTDSCRGVETLNEMKNDRVFIMANESLFCEHKTESWSIHSVGMLSVAFSDCLVHLLALQNVNEGLL